MTDDQRKWIYYAIPAVVVIGLAAALYYGRKQQAPEAEPQVQIAPQPASEEPPIQNPIEDEPDAEQPLPALNDSDPALQDSLAGIFGRSLEPYLVPQNLVRHIVVTVDNLPRKKTAVQMWPVKPMTNQLATSGLDEITLSEDNYARYAPIVKIAQNADSAQIAAMYRRYYPLFQQAYVDLGYPEGYFNDRLIEVIDHLLATPDVAGPITLTQPGVFYEFTDPTLEERSAGQKTLIRIGPQNAAAVKTKLRELRKAVAKDSGR